MTATERHARFRLRQRERHRRAAAAADREGRQRARSGEPEPVRGREHRTRPDLDAATSSRSRIAVCVNGLRRAERRRDGRHGHDDHAGLRAAAESTSATSTQRPARSAGNTGSTSDGDGHARGLHTNIGTVTAVDIASDATLTASDPANYTRLDRRDSVTRPSSGRSAQPDGVRGRERLDPPGVPVEAGEPVM